METLEQIAHLSLAFSLFIFGTVMISGGSLPFIGWMIFLPMTIGSLGLLVSSVNELTGISQQ